MQALVPDPKSLGPKRELGADGSKQVKVAKFKETNDVNLPARCVFARLSSRERYSAEFLDRVPVRFAVDPKRVFSLGFREFVGL